MNSYPVSANQPSVFRLHPLITVAAGSVILVSLLGAAAITGILPNSNANANANVPGAIATSAAADVKPLPALSAQQTTASHKAPVQKTSTQVASASPAPAQPAAAPAQKNSAVGIGIGAVVGGVLGNQFGSGDGKTLATIAGAVGGGYLGNEIAKKNAAP